MKKIKVIRRVSLLACLVLVMFFSVGYSALSTTLNISGNARYNKKYPIRVTGISLQGSSNSGVEQFNPNYTWNTTTTGVKLPNINSTVTYQVTIKNYSNSPYSLKLELSDDGNTNSSMGFSVSNMPFSNIVPANSSVTINVTIKYNTSTLPGTKTGTVVIDYIFSEPKAMFDIGKNVNAKMKKFVNSSATYASDDTTITKIIRQTTTPASTYLTDANIVSSDEYVVPIYMWYQSGTIYWYSAANNVYYNYDSSHFYQLLKSINSIDCINDISSEHVTNMHSMFYNTGSASSTFTLDLGNKFDTTNVTNMNSMFYMTGFSSTSFTLNLRSKFDTSKVTDMTNMFNGCGNASTVFTLSLGSKFDTRNVTTMYGMFMNCGSTNTQFTLTLGSSFYTDECTNTSRMFYSTGKNSTVFTIDVENFSVELVTDMSYMFYETGYSNPNFTLSLKYWDTRAATNMSYMFYKTGYNSTAFTIDLYNDGITSFNTYFVTDMSYMFNFTGYSNPSFTIDLGRSFNTTNVTNMSHMFHDMGHASTTLTLNLRTSFYTSNVLNMSYMFCGCGSSSTSFTLSLGSYFDTSKVTDMSNMFNGCGYGNNSFSLNLGTKFNTAKVTTMEKMFRKYKGTTLDLVRFNTSLVTNMAGMFDTCPNLTTIYVSTSFVVTQVTSSSDMFKGCSNLVGGAGTAWNSSYLDKARAKIDGGTSNPGYFTEQKYYIDLNGKLDGTDSGNLGDYGVCDVTINGSVVATSQSDYYTAWPTGTTFRFDCRANSGYIYNGVVTGYSLTGTVAYSNASTRVSFTKSVPKSFSYTGGIQTYSIPSTGVYKLEVWGASGSGSYAGAGGYSVGYKVLDAGTTVYVVVGGGTYNGGGTRTNTCGCGSNGGGATHIATVSGTLSAIGYQSFVTNGNGLIVAGGGGGAGQDCSYAKGGSGGGTSGGNGMDVGPGRGGSQSSGGTCGQRCTAGSFGQGGTSTCCGGGGGGGFYGGGGGGYDSSGDGDGSGGGGSGWIGGVPSFTRNGTTYSPSTTNASNSGNGKATITLVAN